MQEISKNCGQLVVESRSIKQGDMAPDSVTLEVRRIDERIEVSNEGREICRFADTFPGVDFSKVFDRAVSMPITSIELYEFFKDGLKTADWITDYLRASIDEAQFERHRQKIEGRPSYTPTYQSEYQKKYRFEKQYNAARALVEKYLPRLKYAEDGSERDPFLVNRALACFFSNKSSDSSLNRKPLVRREILYKVLEDIGHPFDREQMDIVYMNDTVRSAQAILREWRADAVKLAERAQDL